MTKKAIILSITSDIGSDVALDWLSKGYDVYGTYRTESEQLKKLIGLGATCFYCDLLRDESIDESSGALKEVLTNGWDLFLSAAGIQDPIGLFEEVDINDWQKSIGSNFVGQMRFLHRLLSARKASQYMPSVIFFAGPGTNNAPKRYSSYVLSKIALIKAVELLDEEIKDTKFTIIGPGWVKTKTHQSTLSKYKKQSGANFQRTVDKLSSNECVPINKVTECVNWVSLKSKQLVGGRNISLVFDRWIEDDLDDFLKKNQSAYKLRRQGNECHPRENPLSEKSLGV